MWRDCFSRRAATVAAAVGFLVAAAGANARVQAQCCGPSGHATHGGHSGDDGAHAGHAQHAGHAEREHNGGGLLPFFERPPHGGQVTVQLPYYFEVVYQPRETHVYIYRPLKEPLAARDVHGEIAMQPHYSPDTFRFPLTFVPPSPDSPEENHLVAATDVRQVPDGQMTVSFKLDNLPLPEQPQIVFRQTFAITRPVSRVVVAALTQADRPGVDRQQVCPVTGASLGSMGTPVKVLLNDEPLFLCCKGCVAKVEQNPQAYSPRPPIEQPELPQDGMQVQEVELIPLTEADWPGIAQQQSCPVTGARLGSMGAPVKVLLNEQTLYLCCEGCVVKVRGGAQAYVPRTPPPRPDQPRHLTQAPTVEAAPLTQADRSGIERQQVCPVTGARLGSMGDPIKLTINGQPVYLCCAGCVSKVQRNPEAYLAQATPVRASR